MRVSKQIESVLEMTGIIVLAAFNMAWLKKGNLRQKNKSIKEKRNFHRGRHKTAKCYKS